MIYKLHASHWFRGQSIAQNPTSNAIINITLKSSKPPLYLVFLLKNRQYEDDFVINAKQSRQFVKDNLIVY